MGIVITYWERYHIGTVGDRFSSSFIESFLIATRATWFYLGKLLWPTQLTFSYPKFEIDASDPLQYVWAIAGAALLWMLWRWRSAVGRAPLAAAIFFVATLSPLLGFIPLFTFWYTYVADHYQYVASIGPIALSSVGATCWLRDHTSLGARGRASAGALVLVVLAALVWNQSRVYESEETLWRDTIAKNPNSWMAQTNLGRFLVREGRFEEAADAYARVFEIRPDTHRAHIGRAGALLKLGREEEAEEHFEAALELKPDLYGPHKALARLAWQRGDLAAALEHCDAMIAIAPGNPMGHYFKGRALQASGRWRAALVHYRSALAIDPDHADARKALERIEGRRAGSSARRRDVEPTSPP
jgi:tetratricopeptide (TPR) repeat protein